jgi:polysaccharide biosynthesis/export protein
MVWGMSGLSSRIEVTGSVGGRVLRRLQLATLAMLFVSLAGLIVTPRVLTAASQQETTGAGSGSGQQPFTSAETIISANDLLFIQVFDVEQMTREYRVNGAGTVDFPPLPEPVQVAGLTPGQAAKAIEKKCMEAGVLSHPQISVTVRESRVHSVSVSGAVRAPQIYPVFGRISLLDLLAQAGGLADDAGGTVTITRGDTSRLVAAASTGAAGDDTKSASLPASVTINVRQLMDTGDAKLNMDVYPGDHVTVSRSGLVYVVGAVSKPGAYSLADARQDMTVLRALALAGSLAPYAKSKSAVLLRPNAAAPKGRDEIPINLRAMLKGDASDRPLQSNDILFIPDSTAMKALHRGADVVAMGVSFAGAAAIMP